MDVRIKLAGALILGICLAAMAAPTTALAAADCRTYTPGTNTYEPDGFNTFVGGTYQVADRFDGARYRGCLAAASEYPRYKGWAGYATKRVGSSCSEHDPRPNGPHFTDMLCPNETQPQRWRYTNNGFVSEDIEIGHGYIHPFGNHSGWRWFYTDGSWYAMQTSDLRIVWYYAVH